MTAEELLNKLKNNKDYQDMFNKKILSDKNSMTH